MWYQCFLLACTLALTVTRARAGFCDGKADGLYVDPTNDNRFVQCANGGEFDFNCAAGLVFNENTKVCVWPDGNHIPITDPPTTEPPVITDSPQTNAPGVSDVTQATQPPNPVTNSVPLPKGAPCQRRVCYFSNWSQYNPTADTIFFPDDIDPDICTHLIYAFATITNNKLAPFEWNDQTADGEVGGYDKAHNLKQKNPSLKILLAVGGWNLGSDPFHSVVNTPASRSAFVTGAVQFLRANKFDGLDVDWEYPGNRGSPADDKHKFSLFIAELRAAFDKEASGDNRLLLTAAVSAGKETIDSAYEIADIAQNLDWINLMTYDLHGDWDPQTGHNSPLYHGANEWDDMAYLNIEWAANYWAKNGAPKEKIVVGLAMYGRSFTLTGSETGVGAPASAGAAGPYTREAGYWAYYEICQLIDKGAQLHFLDDQKVPYLISGKQWVGYDDPSSLREKVRYIRDNGFGGTMAWAIDLDDFKGKFCGKGTYPLSNAIKDECLKPAS